VVILAVKGCFHDELQFSVACGLSAASRSFVPAVGDSTSRPQAPGSERLQFKFASSLFSALAQLPLIRAITPVIGKRGIRKSVKIRKIGKRVPLGVLRIFNDAPAGRPCL
jgi:hypothetical protein